MSTQQTAHADIRPFRIAVDQADLDELRDRLTHARWPRELPGDGWSRGVPGGYLRELAEYWAEGFDWRRQETRLNEFPQFLTEIDGQDVHFLHVRSPEPDAFPLILNHGWPNSFVEFAGMIEPLTARGFDVVVPSVPGFGFSAPPREAGWDVPRVARIWAELMRRLGYDRYGTQGGDLGAYLAPELAAADPDRVAGVYVIGGLGFPTEDDLPELTEEEQASWQAVMGQDWMNGVDHHALLRAAPQTFAYGWQDSPVAALAWMAQKFHEFTTADRPLDQVLDRDLFLTNVSLYWLTGTFGTSSWPMYDSAAGLAWPTGRKTAPTGVFERLPAGGPPPRRTPHHDPALADGQPRRAPFRRHGTAGGAGGGPGGVLREGPLNEW